MSSRADKQAKIAEDARLRAINEGAGQVNAIYGSAGREREYGDYLQALRDRYTADLGEQKVDLDRNTKFRSARQGVIGGSVDVDRKRRNSQNYLKALVGSETRAQGSLGRLRNNDEASRRSLLSLIYSGMDATTAAQRAGYSMQSNTAMAQSDFIPYALDSIGEAAADAYGYGARDNAYSQGGEDARAALYG